MKKHFKGNRYNFELVEEEEGEGYYFFQIKAICKASGRCSSINNTNYVLSQFDYDSEDEEKCNKMSDSTWDIEGGEVADFTEIAESMLSDPSAVKELEDFLDLDRECGEWVDFNNNFNKLLTFLKEFLHISKPMDERRARIVY